MGLWLEIVCDICGASGPSGLRTRIIGLRNTARNLGWVVTYLAHSRADICPECRKKKSKLDKGAKDATLCSSSTGARRPRSTR